MDFAEKLNARASDGDLAGISDVVGAETGVKAKVTGASGWGEDEDFELVSVTVAATPAPGPQSAARSDQRVTVVALTAIASMRRRAARLRASVRRRAPERRAARSSSTARRAKGRPAVAGSSRGDPPGDSEPPQPRAGRPPTLLAACVTRIREILDAGPWPSYFVELMLALEFGASRRTVMSARRAADVVAFQVGPDEGGGWWLTLPPEPLVSRGVVTKPRAGESASDLAARHRDRVRQATRR